MIDTREKILIKIIKVNNFRGVGYAGFAVVYIFKNRKSCHDFFGSFAFF